VHPSALELDEEEHVQPLQEDRLDGEEVDRDHAVRLSTQELAPREPGTLARWPEAGPLEELAHRDGRDRNAKPMKLAEIRW
jgi:hypothetical protein